MSNSYRTLIERLRQFADGHYIIQKFYHGQIDAADLDKEPRYPMMHVLPVDIRASEGTLDYALEIRFADIGRDKEIKTDYQKEIISDMSRIALSLISEIENGQVLFGEDAEIVDKQATIIPFIEEFTHVLTGVQLNVTIRLPFNWSACDIPADYSPNINDNPTTGSGILTKIGVYNDGDFVGYTSFLDFSDDFTATVVDNKIQIVFNGTAGGAGTLQETTDNGNTTTNDIELIDAAEVKFGTGGGVLLDNGSRLREGTIDAGTGGSKGIAQICGVGYELKWEAGSQYVMNGSGDNIRIVNHKFNIPPVVTDDSSSGFYVGSRWILDNGDIYVCTDSTIGAAVWEIETYADWNAASGSREIANKPTIPTNTSDLTNDGEDGVNPFITALDIPSLTGYVPYTGATGDVDLGTHNLTADHISLNVNPSGAGFGVGATQWNNTIGSSQTLLKGGNVTLKNGVDLVARIVNKVTPNTTLTKASYQAVRISGATGGRLSVALARADSDTNSADTIGLVCETIATNQEGFIITVGQLLDINTTGSLQGETWADGDVLYLSPTTAGRITKVKPTGATGHIVVIGYVEYAHANNGSIYVKVMNGWELDELHNVNIVSPTNGQALLFNSTSDLWENQNIPSADWGVLSLTETSARYDNYTPTGWNDEKVISINANYTDKIQVYSGIAGGYAGRMVTIQNSSTDNLMILEKNSTNSSAANRMRFQGRSAYFLFPSEQITLLHNGTDWGVLSSDSNNGHMAFDDMLGAPNAASPTSYFGETTIGQASGTGAIIRNDNQILNGLGTITFTTGTVANNSGTLKSMGRSGFFASAGSFSKYCVVSRIRLDQLPTAAQDFIFGVGISAGSNATGITTVGSMSWYASNGNAFWRNYSSSTAGTLITDTTTSLAVTTNAIVLGTYHPNNLGDCVFFYSSDGGMTYAVSSRFVRVSNNYAGAPVIGVNKLVGVTAIQASVDYVGITCKGGVI
jgi:nitrogen fixation protein